MGKILSAECSCGFSSGGLLCGGGFTTFKDHCYLPAVCKDCSKIVVGDLLAPGKECIDCGHDIVFYNDPSLTSSPDNTGKKVFEWNIFSGGTVSLTDNYYLCPKCRQMNLKFKDAGSWD